MKIFYLGYFSTLEGDERFCSLAANNVCTYIKDTLCKDSKDEIVVVNLAQDKRHYKFSKSLRRKKENCTFISIPRFGSGRLLSPLSTFLASRWIKRFLAKEAGDNDKAIIYHSLNTLKLEIFISKHYHSILQVEEIYGDVLKKPDKTKAYELSIINSFMNHIFVSESLRNDPRIKSNRNAVFYGSYSLPKLPNVISKDKKSIVYSGTLEKNKGIEFACELMKSLPEYKLHIYGFGSELRKKELLEEYGKLPNIEFHQPVSDVQLNHLLPFFTFGLSPLDPKLGFASTAFPSKILTYLKSNLIVISSKFDSVLKSPFKNYVILADYDIDSFKQAIIDAHGHNIDGRKLIKELDLKFKKDLIALVYEA